MQFSELLGHFAEVEEQADGGYLAACPAHSDSRPSLRIWRGEDLKVRVTCRAGCKPGDVVESAGLRWPDLFNAEGDGETVPAERPALVGTGAVAGLRVWLDTLGLTAAAEQYAWDRFGLDASALGDLGVTGFVPDVDDGGYAPVSRTFARFPRLVVPLNGFDGVTRGAQGRDLTGECPGRWISLSNPQGHRWAPYGVFRGAGGYGVTLVTEGPGDGLTGVAVGYDVVMVRGAALAGSPELLAEIAEGVRGTQVIACGDNDSAGQAFNAKLAEGLKPYGIDVYALAVPADLGVKADLTDWREADPKLFADFLHSAVKMAKPVTKPEDTQRAKVSAELSLATGSDTVTVEQGAEAGRMLSGLLDRYSDTDAMRAHALVAWCGGTIRFARGLGFHVWNGKVWQRDASADLVRQEVHRMGAALVLAKNKEYARPFLTTRGIDDLLTELRSVPSVRVDASEFDARPELLTFNNGTVDLRTRKLRPHSQEDMLTYALSIDYVEDAPAPRWEAFLSEIMPGMPEMVDYLRRLTGYGITGSADEQCFCVLWGKGANGKSVFTDVLSTIFAEINKTTPFSTFEERTSGGIPNDIAALRGARLVMASEGESDKPMSEAVLKRITGKDVISARFLRQEFFEFKPSFLLMLATNHKPQFKGQDEGLWRRVRMIHFKRWFAPHERDLDLGRKLEAEAEGIAAWAVRGASEWLANGLQDPAQIREATEEYRETSDMLAGFYPGVLVESAGDRVQGAAAYTAYREWCDAEGLQAREIWTRKKFYTEMENRQIQRVRGAQGMTLVGVRMADQGPKPTGPGIFGSDD